MLLYIMRMLKKLGSKVLVIALVISVSVMGLSVMYSAVSAGSGIPVPSVKPAALVVQEAFIPVPSAKPYISRAEAMDIRDLPVPARKPEFAKFYSGMTPDKDSKLYKQIFALQKSGKMQQADSLIAKLRGETLMGHILYQRYMHPTAYSSSYNQLHSWMENYADHPGAKNIYALAMKRRAATETRRLREPVKNKFVAPMREPTMVPGRNFKRDKNLSAAQKERIEIFEAKANIAARAYYGGRYEEAYDLSREVYRGAGTYLPKASWIYGLSNWRKSRFRTAAEAFEMVANSPYASGWESSAGAYWAARAHIRTSRKKDARSWLAKAAQHPRTFYGLIATRALSKPYGFNWNTPVYAKDHYKKIAATAAGERAIALVNAGQIGLAEQELKRVNARRSPKLQEALLAYAEYVGMPGVSMRLGSIVRGEGGVSYDGALYPKSSWKIYGKGQVNRELVYALIRQESRFDPIAKSYSGAAGLMQIMPTTAAYVTKQPIYKTSAGRVMLEQPERNLEIGVKYLKELASLRSVDSSLFNLLIAYNAGPGNLAKWKRAQPNLDDSLLFIESLPSAETRVYVERVLANYWIYRMKSGKDTATLDAIALGQVPQVKESDIKVARKQREYN